MNLRKIWLSFLVIILSLTVSSQAFAVSEAAVLFLLISPSPQANAMGCTYGTTVSTSPMATIMNPAALGIFAQENYFGHEFYSEKIPWLPALVSDMYYDAKATSFGLNLNPYLRLPLFIGVSRQSIFLDLGEQFYTSEDGPEVIDSFESHDKATSTSFALSVDHHIKASLGISFKNIASKLAPAGWGENYGSTTSKVSAWDIGLILQAPLQDFYKNSGWHRALENDGFSTFFEPGILYSLTNIGDEITYIDAANADPLPRNLTLGIHLKAGLNYKGFNLIHFGYAREVEDLLIDTEIDWENETYSREYASGLHDIDIWNDLILGKTNDKVITKRGHSFNFAGVYSIRSGKYQDIEGKVIYRTEGTSIDYLNIAQFLLAETKYKNHPFVKFLHSLSFERHTSKVITDEGHPLTGTEFTSYVLRVKNFAIN